jgi:hypothetical protein
MEKHPGYYCLYCLSEPKRNLVRDEKQLCPTCKGALIYINDTKIPRFSQRRETVIGRPWFSGVKNLRGG